MPDYFYEVAGRERLDKFRELSGGLFDEYLKYHEKVFAAGKLSRREKELIAVAGTHITRCPYCITTHIKAALAEGITPEEIAEAILLAGAINGAACLAHAGIATRAME